MTSASTTPARYEIRVTGQLDPSWSRWFDGLELHHDPAGDTVLLGPVPDASALHGILTRLHDLGTTLTLVRRVDGDAVGGNA